MKASSPLINFFTCSPNFFFFFRTFGQNENEIKQNKTDTQGKSLRERKKKSETKESGKTPTGQATFRANYYK